MEKSFAVLIVAYQRIDTVREILSRCYEAGIEHVLLSLDYPRIDNAASIAINQQIQALVDEFEGKFVNFSKRFFSKNVGCSANVLSACDWAFERYEFVAILEDDCLPSQGFFEYCHEATTVLMQESKILLACGTQFCPLDVTFNAPFISKYALTWGWFTSAKKWRIIREEIISRSERRSVNLFSWDTDKVYWSEGARRAYEGYVDVWDTPLVSFLSSSPFWALLPSKNMVTNVGNDSIATHTASDATWTQLASNAHTANSLGNLIENAQADKWLKKNFYRIRFRHLLSTRLTRFRDRFKSPFFDELILRWNNATN